MKKNLQKLSMILLTVLLTVSTGLVHAQWNTNTSVNLQISGLLTADMQLVPTTDGKMWVAFYHENAGNYDMRAQLIDADGNKLLGANGVLVSNQPSGSATFVFNACSDASNNLIIGMQDERSGTMQAVLYKVAQNGSPLWGADGIILGGGMVPWPAALSNGEVIAVWNGSSTLNIQKITTGGTLAWATPKTVMVGTSTTTRGQIVANLNGKFTMVYQKNAGGISTNLYAQQFDNDGIALYSPLQICNQTTAAYRYYSIIAEGDTTYFGYFSSTGFRFNSFLQRINPNGTIPWGMNGSAFNTSTGGSDNYQMETSIKLTNGSPYVWAVSSFCDPNQTNYGVYIQKYLKTSGARQFTDLGKMVYPVTANRDIQAGDLALINDTPMFMSYQDNYKIYATRLDGSGNFAWPHTRTEISSTTYGPGSPKGRYGFTAASATRCAGIWTEDRGSGDLGYAQGVTIGGLIGMDVATQGGVPATITTGAGTLQMVATIYPSYANQAATWSIVPGTGLASISASGLVTAIADGTVWAKAVAVQDVTVKDSLLITISGQIPVLADVVTLPATNIDLTVATLNGTVDANNFISTVSFEWGLTASYGNTVASVPALVTGSTATPVLAELAGLTPGTTYHFRCVAVNGAGTAYGADLTFTTECLLAGTIGAISGSANVCEGSTGNVYSVDPFANAAGYIWTVPPGAIITAGNNTNSITVDFAPNSQSGDFIVYATDGTCFSFPSEPFPVNVSYIPSTAGTITGIQSVCEGDQGITYSVSAIPGATSYAWSVPTGAVIASGQNTNSIVVNYAVGSVSGNISVTGSNSCGTGAAANLPVDVAPLPGNAGVITGSTVICAEANNVIYSVATITNAFGYVWTLPPGAEIVSGANTNQVTLHYTAGATSGNITVYGTNGNCLGQPSLPLFINVNPTPATPVITHHGDTLVSSADAGNQWYLDGVEIPGANGKEHVAVYAGNYSVMVTLNGCSSALSNSILILPVSVRDDSFGRIFEIFPNPNNGKFDIKIETDKEFAGTLEVYNNLGTIIWQHEKIVINGTTITHVDLQEVPAGTYTVVIRNNNNSVFKKVLITR
jgi:hypothetical protein